MLVRRIKTFILFSEFLKIFEEKFGSRSEKELLTPEDFLWILKTYQELPLADFEFIKVFNERFESRSHEELPTTRDAEWLETFILFLAEFTHELREQDFEFLKAFNTKYNLNDNQGILTLNDFLALLKKQRGRSLADFEADFEQEIKEKFKLRGDEELLTFKDIEWIETFIFFFADFKQQIRERDLQVLKGFNEKYKSKSDKEALILKGFLWILKKYRDLSVADFKPRKYDIEFLEAFNERFQSRLDEEELTPDDYEWIEKKYAERWNFVADKPRNDYTFYPEGYSTPWVYLARELERELGRSYLVILMPTLVNEIEPNLLTSIKDIADPRSIFRSSNNIWHQQETVSRGIAQNSALWGIRDYPKEIGQTKTRALTIEEFWRISQKRGEYLKGTRARVIYESFWHFILHRSAPDWQKYGHIPTQYLSSILKLVEHYFQVRAGKATLLEFQNTVKAFSDELQDCSLINTNYLYAAKIQVGEKTFCLIEILVDCLDKEDLDEKLLGVASWICDVNPSLISRSEALQPVYQVHMAGPYFNLNFLYELVINLKVEQDEPEYRLYKPLIDLLEKVLHEEVPRQRSRQEVVIKIKELYNLRWKHIGGPPNDYFCIEEGDNRLWVRLVQYMAGAGWIEPNYYGVLIPTLKKDVDPVTLELVTQYPLSDQILSANGKSLINLHHSIRHHQVNGTFLNCQKHPPVPFTRVEKIRIAYAAPEIYEYFRKVETEKFDDPPLKRETIEKLKEFINIALVPAGLTAPRLSDTETDIVSNAYSEFRVYLSLHPDEKAKLYQQRVKSGSSCLTAGELFFGMKTGICSSQTSRQLAQLFADYNIVTKLRGCIEAETKVDMESMRRTSAKKVYSDYADLTEQEAKKRLLSLIVSLFTHRYTYIWYLSWLGLNKVTLLEEYTNFLPVVGVDLYTLLEKTILKGDFQHARFFYVQILEHLVPEAIASPEFSRSEDTHNWLTQIADGTLFKGENQLCFEPELLFVVVWECIKKNSDNRKLVELNEKFLHEVTKLLLKPTESYKSWIFINIEFFKLLNNTSMPAKVSLELLAELRAKEGEDMVSCFKQANKDYFIHRLAQIAANKSGIGLFGTTPQGFKKEYENKKIDLENRLPANLENPAADNQTQAQNAQEAMHEVVTKFLEALKDNQSASMRAYLLGILPKTDQQNRGIVSLAIQVR